VLTIMVFHVRISQSFCYYLCTNVNHQKKFIAIGILFCNDFFLRSGLRHIHQFCLQPFTSYTILTVLFNLFYKLDELVNCCAPYT